MTLRKYKNMKPLKYYFHHLLKKNNGDTSIKTKNIDESFNYLQKQMEENERVFFVRFGDGEFVTLMKRNHRNYKYNEKLDREIEESFNIKDPNYLISCPINYPYDQYIAKSIYTQFSWQQEMIDLIKSKKLDTSFTFENPCIFQCLTVFNPIRFKSFLDTYIRPKTKMFIGSTEKEVAEKLYGKIDYYVQIPTKHAYETIDTWWPQIEENYKNVDLVIPSAGSTSNVISLRLWNLGYHKKLIDFGSVVDAVDNKTTRSWIRLQGHKANKLLSVKPKISFNQKITFLLKDIKFYFRNQFI